MSEPNAKLHTHTENVGSFVINLWVFSTEENKPSIKMFPCIFHCLRDRGGSSNNAFDNQLDIRQS